jgi:hypothetical protein
MNLSEAGKILAYASAGDNRTVTREAALIWSESLDADITMDEARRAINTHFGGSVEYLKPAHINALVRRQRAVSREVVPPVVPPRDLADTPHLEIAWTRVWGDAVIAGRTEDRARQIANRQFEIDEDTEPLALEAGTTASLREALNEQARELVRKQSLREADARAKAAEKKARYDAIRAAELDRKTDTNGDEA